MCYENGKDTDEDNLDADNSKSRKKGAKIELDDKDDDFWGSGDDGNNPDED